MKVAASNPLLSVIVPIYRVEPYLERCVQSIRNQTYQNLEIILVDDGSDDQCPQICDRFADIDERVKVVHKENGGLVSARKAGITEASGKYAAYVDSDDWIECDMYQQLVKQIVENDADIVTSGVYRDYSNDRIAEFDRLREGVYDSEGIKSDVLPTFMYTGVFYEAGVNIHIYNKVFKRELLIKHQLRIEDSIRIGEDAALVYPYILDAKKMVITHKCFYHYCIRNDSIMAKGYRDELKGYQEIYKMIKAQMWEEKYLACREQLVMQLNYFMLYELLLKEPQLVIAIDNDNLFPFHNVRVKDRLVLYGGGKFGSTLHRFIKEQKWCEIVLWVDKDEDSARGIESSSKLNDIAQESYDRIILAVLVNSVADKIQGELIEMGIEKDRIARIDVTEEDIERKKEWKKLLEG